MRLPIQIAALQPMACSRISPMNDLEIHDRSEVTGRYRRPDQSSTARSRSRCRIARRRTADGAANFARSVDFCCSPSALCWAPRSNIRGSKRLRRLPGRNMISCPVCRSGCGVVE
jgi:hypothetical protein